MTEQEYAALIEQARPELVRIASRRCGRDLAEDAVQKLFTRYWTNRRWERSSPETFIRALRRGAVLNGFAEGRQIGRFRAAQKNFLAAAYTGHKRASRGSRPEDRG
jgi:DNA-directed RNA polymerase specialized sigma24 family protein